MAIDSESRGKVDEQRLIKLYMDLTGTTEAEARSVFMYISRNGGTRSEGSNGQGDAEPGPSTRSGTGLALAMAFLVLLTTAGLGRAATPTSNATNLLARPLSLAEAINVALERNPAVLRAQKDIEAAEGVSLQTRAIILPKVGITGNYSATASSDIDQLPGFAVSFGANQGWRSQIRLVQSIYEGGRMVSAFRAARLSREQSILNYQTAVAETILAVQTAYYDVLLGEQQIKVQEASVELLKQELTDTTRRYDAGTVPRFNVLRAEVEVANARPRLIRARNDYRIAKNNLVNLLGLNLRRETFEDIPLNLSQRLEAEPYDIDLSRALNLAFEHRTELGALRKAEALRKEDIVSAKAGYRPSLQGFAGYDVHSSMFSNDLTDEFHGWIAGVELTWNIFDGLQTRGRVKQARALYERAGIDLDDAMRRIELEVRTAFSNFIEAREVLESQKKVVEEGEEALRLATARNQAGTGTQLDVLSAQTALTEARTTQIQALRDYEVARAKLDRAIGLNLPANADRP